MGIKRHQHPWKTLVAGALGGLAGSLAMGQFYSLLIRDKGTSSDESKEDSTVKAASEISESIFHHELTLQQKKFAGPAVHYLFGASMGAAYGTFLEVGDLTCTGWGMPFGAAVWLGAHVIAVPALNLSEPITRSSPATEGAEFAAHLVYGVVVEGVRRFLQRR
jgi:uncharacterized membrane protein YagU involved in acid resistance